MIRKQIIFLKTITQANMWKEVLQIYLKRGTWTITAEGINIPKWIQKLVKLKLQWHKRTNVGKNMDKLESWYIAGENVKWYLPALENILVFL